MPRYTPLYGLPALDPGDKLRTLPDTDWQRAQTLEAILQDQGQMPLDSDLVSLLARLTALESNPVPYFYAANIGAAAQAVEASWKLINAAVAQQANVGGFGFAAGALTIPQDGLYFVEAGFVAANGTVGNRGIQASLNNAAADKAVIFKNEAQAYGNLQGVPVALSKGDVIRFFYISSNVSGNLGSTAGDTFIKAYRIGPRA